MNLNQIGNQFTQPYMKFDTNLNQIFFISDLHFAHKNICRGTSVWRDESATRDFETLAEMNETLLQNLNNCVKEDDILFHLGDFSFQGTENIRYFRERINCKNIHLILDNHDQNIFKNKQTIDGTFVKDLFSSVQDYLEIEIDKKLVVLCHYPFLYWRDSHKGSINLFGHEHGMVNDRIKPNQFDVGVDNIFRKFGTYSPISFEQILQQIEKQNMIQSGVNNVTKDFKQIADNYDNMLKNLNKII
jgi:calcineurin-like phosphoesterase family protein